MANIRDVAKLAGVSTATVSRVINQRGYVHKHTEEKIKESMRQLHYTPNPLARGLSIKKTQTIGLIIPDITNPFFPELARAVEDTARKLGYTLILANSDNQEKKALSYIHIFKQRFVDGVIFASHQLSDKEVDALYEIDIPIVAIDRAASSKSTSSIRINHYQGGVLATKHLLEIGCKKIAYIGGPATYLTAMERHQGYIDTMRDWQCYDSSLVVEGDFSLESGLIATQNLLSHHPDLDGIFAANDVMAVGSLKTLLRSGRKVPEDVAIIGFDGISMLQAMEPEISTISQPIYEIGSLAVQTLINHHKSKMDQPSVVELEIELIKRRSTAR